MSIYIPTSYKQKHYTTHPYTIYKITNLINGKIYIGQHDMNTQLGDRYCCSGLHISRSIMKHGADNFKREIIFEFDNFEEMNLKERKMVTPEFIEDSQNYNLMEGGKNGVHSTYTKLKISRAHKGRVISTKTKAKMSAVKVGKDLSKRHRMEISKGKKGTVLSDVHKQNISRSKLMKSSRYNIFDVNDNIIYENIYRKDALNLSYAFVHKPGTKLGSSKASKTLLKKNGKSYLIGCYSELLSQKSSLSSVR